MDNKTFIFDVDGTLFDTLDLLIDCLYINANKAKIKISKKGLYNLIENKSLHEIINDFNFNKLHLLYITWKIRKDFEKRINEVKVFENIISILEYLKSKNYDLYILTSNKKEFVDKKLDEFNLDFFTKKYYKSSVFGKAKYIEKIIKKNNLEKNNIYYVGDEIRDIEACKKAEIKCISVCWGYNSKNLLRDFKPDFLVEKIEDFKKIIF